MENDKRLFKAVLVDDEIWALRGLAGIVDWAEYGFDVVGKFTDSSEALLKIGELKPDVVFTDIRMPGIDGMKLIESIRKADSHVSFVIVSAYRDFEIARKAMKQEVSEYLIKPLDKAEVKNTLTALYTRLSSSASESFDIKNFDLSSDKALKNPDVIKFFKAFKFTDRSRILLSDSEIKNLPGLTPVSVGGFDYAYILSECDNPYILEDRLKGTRIGLSTALSSFEEIPEKIKEAGKSFRGCFFFSYNEQTAKIQEYLFDNLENKISMEDVCGHFFLSKSYVFELFRLHTVTSAMGFLKRVRLCRAADLLKEKGASVSGVASRVGFDDVGYFIKTFKAKYGVTPEQYSQLR